MQIKSVMLKFPFLILMGLSGFMTSSPAQKSSLLWKISGNGLAAPSYLFGTFHILCKEDFFVSDILAAKFRSTKKFYGELKMDDPALQVQLMSKMTMAGKTLESLMTKDEYSRASQNFQDITGMKLNMFNNFKPFVPLSLLAIKSINCSGQVQPETEFLRIANDNHIQVAGLETVDDQVNAIDKQPLDSQVNSLKQMLQNFDSVKISMSKMIAVYKGRNIDSIYALMRKEGVNDSFEADLITDRNRKWLPLIKKAIMASPIFIAVGAGHLGGPGGVLNLLRRQGYKVTPVMY